MHRIACAGLIFLVVLSASAVERSSYNLFARTNLVAWCIVPFDARKRGPEERAEMLQRLGITKFAYDYRAEHIPQWDRELAALKQRKVELLAWWFPTTMNREATATLELFNRHHVRPQLWVMGSGAPATPAKHAEHLEAEVRRIRQIAEAAQPVGCTVGLYNHGGWFGQPSNQIAIIERLKSSGVTNVGIVYNLHHGHEHLDRFPDLLREMRPHLLVLNLNGMFRDGERRGLKIAPVGQGDADLPLLRAIVSSGWTGPIGILNHTDEDAEGRLKDNLGGLEWLAGGVQGRLSGEPPKPTTWSLPKK
jgi:sugar phosphate isomerase/epimerase